MSTGLFTEADFPAFGTHTHTHISRRKALNVGIGGAIAKSSRVLGFYSGSRVLLGVGFVEKKHSVPLPLMHVVQFMNVDS